MFHSRPGLILGFLVSILLALVPNKAAAEAVHTPILELPNDTAVFLCLGDSLCYEVIGTDTDPGDTLVLKLLSGPISFPTTTFYGNFKSQVCFRPQESGDYLFIWQLTDHFEAKDIDTVRFTVTVGTPPALEDQFFSLAQCDGALGLRTLQVVAADPNAGQLQYSILSGPGSIDMLTGLLTYQPTGSGTTEWLIQVNNDCGFDRAKLFDSITVNLLPNLKLADTTIRICDETKLCLDLVSFDPDGSTVFVSLVSPFGTFEPNIVNGGRLCLVPTLTDTTYEFVFCLRDECPADIFDTVCTYDTLRVTVRPAGSNGELSCPEAESLFLCQPGYVCLPFTSTFPKTDVSFGSLTDSSICFFADTSGLYQITIIGSDSCTTDSCLVEVAITINQPPALPLDFYADTVDLCAPGTFCIDIETLGLELDPDNNIVGYFSSFGNWNGTEICGTVDTAGRYLATLIVTDSCGAADTGMVDILVRFNPPPTLTIFDTSFVSCLPDTSNRCLRLLLSGAIDSLVVLSGPVTAGCGKGTLCLLPATAPGTYTVIAAAYDSCGAVAIDTAQVLVENNQPPVVVTAPDFDATICQAESICVAVTIDDPEFGSLEISTSFGTYDRSRGRVCFLADTSASYLLIVTATDSCGLSDADTTIVTVTVNEPPVVLLGADSAVTSCQIPEICIPVEVSDANLVSVTSNYGLYDPERSVLCFVPDTSGRYTIFVQAVDDCDVLVRDTIIVNVSLNHPPSISGFDDTTVYLCRPAYICLDPLISDSDGDIVSIVVSRGTYKDGSVCFVPYDSGTYPIILTVTDSCGNLAVDTAIVNVRTDQQILLTCPEDTSIFICQPETLCFPIGGIPANATVKVRGTGVWFDAEKSAVCFYSDCCFSNKIFVDVITACGTTTCSFVVNVISNSKPLVALPPDMTTQACELAEVCIPVGISDVDQNLASVSPSIGTYDPYRNTVCFRPDTAGTYLLTVTATDSCGESDLDQILIRVGLNRPPTVEIIAQSIIEICGPTQVCFPFSAIDLDGNLKEVLAGGSGTLRDGQVCFMADSSGQYAVSVLVTDSCGASDSSQVTVTVLQGEIVSISCPDGDAVSLNRKGSVLEKLLDDPHPLNAVLCAADTICLPLAITGNPDSVVVSYGTFAGDTLCFLADTTGLYTFTVIAAGECNVDTCRFSYQVTVEEPALIACPSDTAVELCGPDTLCFPIGVTPASATVSVDAPAYFLNGMVCLPITSGGVQTVTLIATTACGSDTCQFEVSAVLNEPPFVEATPDTTLALCQLREICIPFVADDPDGNLADVSSSLGVISGTLAQLVGARAIFDESGEAVVAGIRPDQTVCFTPEQFGQYTIILTATDSCGLSDVDTVIVKVTPGDTVAINCPVDPIDVETCGAGEFCFPLTLDGTPNEIAVVGGTYRDGEICLAIDTTGLYEVVVIASADCLSDTCTLRFNVVVADTVSVTCLTGDTTVTACAPDSIFRFPVTISGTPTSVTLLPSTAVLNGSFIELPVDRSGRFDVQLIVASACNSDTCGFAVNAEVNQSPTISGPDTTITLCDISEICLPIKVTDPDNNLVELRSSLGQISDSLVCFTPPVFGSYTIILTAIDTCGLLDRDTLLVSVVPGDTVHISCPDQTISRSIPIGDTLFVPLPISPAGAAVTVLPEGSAFYQAESQRIVFPVTATGVSTLTVVAQTECAIDSCLLTIDIGSYTPPQVDCQASVDTAICIDSVQQFCFTVPIVGTDLRIRVAPIGSYIDGQVCIPVDSSGSYEITIIAENDFDADTCISTVTVSNVPVPLVELPPAFEVTLCSLGLICVPLDLNDIPYRLDQIETNIGYYDSLTSSVCAQIDTAGLYTVIVAVTNDCGIRVVDTSVVTVNLKQPPRVDLGPDQSRIVCALEEICLPVMLDGIDPADLIVTGGTYLPDSGFICLQPDRDGLYLITASATDSCGNLAIDTLRLQITRTTTVTLSVPDTSVFLCRPGEICLPISLNVPSSSLVSLTTSRGSIKNGAVCFVPYNRGSYDLVITATDSCGTVIADTALVAVETDQSVELICPTDTTLFLCEPDTLCFPVGGIPTGATVTVGGTGAWFDPLTSSICFYSDCCIENNLLVTVTTACGTKFYCAFTVTVMTNSRPLVFLPRDTTITQCQSNTICLPVAFSDFDQNIASVSVTGGLYDPQAKRVCVTTDQPGQYEVRVTVTDSCGETSSDLTIITVTENRPPVISYLVPQDTLIRQCAPSVVCLPISFSDPDANLASVSVTGGTYDPERSVICITPDGTGIFCATVIAIDSCGAADSIEACIRVESGGFASIDCPSGPLTPDTLCLPGTVCFPVAVNGTPDSISTSFGQLIDGQLCFDADTSGLYSVRIIAAAACGADTCTFEQPVVILPAVSISCPPSVALFPCGPDTVCYPYEVSGSGLQVSVSAPAYLSGGLVCLPLLGTDTTIVTMIASNQCGADTCSFTVGAIFNRPPVANAGRDTTILACTLTQVCIQFTAADPNGNLQTVSVSNGTIVGSTICLTPTAFGTVSVILTATDSCGASDADTVTITVTQLLQAEISCPSGTQFATLCKPDTVRILVPISPSNAVVTVSPAGIYKAASSQVCFFAPASGTYPITVIASTPCGTDTCSFSVQVTINQPPVVSCPGQIDTTLCLTQPGTLCFPVSVSGTGINVVVRPAGTYAAGQVCIPITQAGVTTYSIIATGTCGVDTCQTRITIRDNEAPLLTVPDGQTFERCPADTGSICIPGIFATDSRENVILTKVCGTGSLELARADSGQLCFMPDTTGTYLFCVEASDGCRTAVDTITVVVLPKEDCDLCVRFGFDWGDCTPVGLLKRIALTVESNTLVGGFDLLISYDASALNLQTATTEGTATEDWEFFTWSIGSAGCGQACPSGLVRFVGIADANNGLAHPPTSAYSLSGVLVWIDFLVANDQSLGNQFVPINFVWYACPDNSVSDPTGQDLFVDTRIYGAGGLLLWDESDNLNFPETARPFGMGAPDDCVVGTDKGVPTRCIEFTNGGICIIDPDSIDARGDVNLNDLAYEIADAVVFNNYFIFGLAAFTKSIPGQIAATDINADGRTLTVVDLTMMIRIIIGDIPPVPKFEPYEEPAQLAIRAADGRYTTTATTSATIGAAWLRYDLSGEITVNDVRVGSGATGMQAGWHVEGNRLNVLLYDIGTNRVDAGENELVEILSSGTGTISLASAEITDYYAQPYRIGSAALPTQYLLEQNYPNPFNPTTTIEFSLPSGGEWELAVYNVAGALVRNYSGSSDAGVTQIVWDSRDESGLSVASGVYFYRLTAGSYRETRKMILLK